MQICAHRWGMKGASRGRWRSVGILICSKTGENWRNNAIASGPLEPGVGDGRGTLPRPNAALRDARSPNRSPGASAPRGAEVGDARWMLARRTALHKVRRGFGESSSRHVALVD